MHLSALGPGSFSWATLGRSCSGWGLVIGQGAAHLFPTQVPLGLTTEGGGWRGVCSALMATISFVYWCGRQYVSLTIQTLLAYSGQGMWIFVSLWFVLVCLCFFCQVSKVPLVLLHVWGALGLQRKILRFFCLNLTISRKKKEACPPRYSMIVWSSEIWSQKYQVLWSLNILLTFSKWFYLPDIHFFFSVK